VNGFVRMGFLRALNSHADRSVIPRLVLAIIIASGVAALVMSLTLKTAGLIEYTLPDLVSGDISPNREIALFDFQVPKTPDQLEMDHRDAIRDVLPVFSHDPLISEQVLVDLDSLFTVVDVLAETPGLHDDAIIGSLPIDITTDTVRQLTRVLARNSVSPFDILPVVGDACRILYDRLIVFRQDDLARIAVDAVMIEDAMGQLAIPIDDIIDLDEAREILGERVAATLPEGTVRSVRNAVTDAAHILLRPNLHYNASRTGERRDQAILSVNPTASSYKKNELIIEANVPVTESNIAALAAYRSELATRTFGENRRKHFGLALARTVLILGVIGIFAAYVYLYRKRVYKSFSHLLLLSLIAALPLSVAYYAAWSGTVSEYLVPVAMATILATILFDAEIGMMLAVAVSLVTATMVTGDPFRMAIVYCLAGGTGVLTVGRVRHRREFYRSMLFVPLAMLIAVAATHDWVNDTSYTGLSSNLLLAAMNGFFCPIIAIGLLPVLESVFKVVTDITLLELSDLNNPLLRDLAVRAPGTFSSVLMVGALAESASERIGANPLLARVGSYYHDIGKITIPDYFIENQYGGVNPHDRLLPHMSALVIASHVKEGYELGLRYGLPQSILDIIQQHHGTSLMASIYHKAKESAPEGTEVDESSYSYPGPRPQTREAGVVMLADLVEAASRSIKEQSPSKFKTLINTIIQRRFLDGELDECDLTLKDLHNIEESFVPVLVGSRHERIKYPWQKDGDTPDAGHEDNQQEQDEREDEQIVDERGAE
jgi:cyclic-di-AMP phosphodiesterase PgpH